MPIHPPSWGEVIKDGIGKHKERQAYLDIKRNVEKRRTADNWLLQFYASQNDYQLPSFLLQRPRSLYDL